MECPPLTICLASRGSWTRDAARPAWARKNALTKRQTQLAACFALGLGDREIARRLGLTQHTVRSYAKHLYQRLAVETRLQVALYVLGAVAPQAASHDLQGAASTRWARSLKLPPHLARVAAGVDQALSDKQIASALDLRPSTVRTYVKQIYRRLGGHTRASIMIAIRGRARVAAR